MISLYLDEILMYNLCVKISEHIGYGLIPQAIRSKANRCQGYNLYNPLRNHEKEGFQNWFK